MTQTSTLNDMDVILLGLLLGGPRSIYDLRKHISASPGLRR